MSGKLPEKTSPYESNANPVVTLTKGTEGATASNCIRVTATFANANGQALSEQVQSDMWISDSSIGLGFTASAPTTIAVGSKGGVGAVTAGKYFKLATNASGVVEIDITDAGTSTWYVCVGLPNGRFSVLAVTFA
jgi:hypothetical protein